MRRGLHWIVIASLLACLAFIQPASAFYLDEANTMEFKGKFQTRLSISTEDPIGFTSPRPSAGDIVQHRNFLYLEFNHDLKNYQQSLGGLEVKYHLLGRIMYDGVYDYGPTEFQLAKNFNSLAKERIDEFKLQPNLWEAYADVTKGPFFLRLGRQKLAWGETDLFRLLDNINPLDNTFGGIFEDLDDRRIPIFMARTSYNFGKVGPVSSFMIEGFIAPSAVDDKISPIAPFGTRYSLPLPPVQLDTIKPGSSLEDSRYGIRQMGVLFDAVNYTLAYEHTTLDMPGIRINVAKAPEPPFILVQDLVYEPIDVVGGSASYYWGLPDVVLRSEIAYFMDEPVFIPQKNMNYLYNNGLGEIPTKDFLRFAVGVDKNVWIRALNPDKTFFFSAQYFGQVAGSYDHSLVQPVPLPPTGSSFTSVKEYEQTITFLANTEYYHGRIKPQISIAYDPRGATFIQPQVEFVVEPFRILLQYSTISGNMTGFGFFKDRDQFTTAVTWLF